MKKLLTLLTLMLAVYASALDCKGGSILVDKVTELPDAVYENCRFNFEPAGLLGWETKDGITLRNNKFYSYGAAKAVWFNDSTNITVAGNEFHGFTETPLGFTSGSNFTIIDNVIDADLAQGIVVDISPGHWPNVRREAVDRGAVFKPENRWKSGTGLGAGIGNLGADRRGVSKEGGRYGYFTYTEWYSGIPQAVPYWNDSSYNGDLKDLRVRCYWPGMTGYERFRIVEKVGTTFKIECIFGSFPVGQFVFYVDNPNEYIENIIFKRNIIRGGRLSGLSIFYGRGVEIRDNITIKTSDYGVGVEFGERIGFYNNNTYNYQHDTSKKLNWSSIQMVGFADRVRFVGNNAICDVVPWGMPQTNISGDFVFRTSGMYNAEKIGFPRPDGAKLTW